MRAIDFAARLAAALYADNASRSLFRSVVMLNITAGADTPNGCAVQMAAVPGTISAEFKKLAAEGLIRPKRNGSGAYELTDKGKEIVRGLLAAAENKISISRYAWK